MKRIKKKDEVLASDEMLCYLSMIVPLHWATTESMTTTSPSTETFFLLAFEPLEMLPPPVLLYLSVCQDVTNRQKIQAFSL